MLMAYIWRFESYLYDKFVRAYRFLALGVDGNSRKDTNSINDIKILHDSPHFLVVDKAPDILINSDADKITVERQLIHLYPDLVNPNLHFSFHFVNRLDFPTSGILCLAKNRKAAAIGNEQFCKRKTEKYYLAIVRGHLSQNYVVIDEPIGRDTRVDQYENSRMACQSMPYCEHDTCKEAKTHLMLLEVGSYVGRPASKILLRPITGRRHQLRLHCHIIGHTIVGDFTYSDREDILPHRMFLHSYKLILNNRLEPLNVVSDDPFTETDPANHCWKPDRQIKSIGEALKELSSLA